MSLPVRPPPDCSVSSLYPPQSPASASASTLSALPTQPASQEQTTTALYPPQSAPSASDTTSPASPTQQVSSLYPPQSPLRASASTSSALPTQQAPQEHTTTTTSSTMGGIIDFNLPDSFPLSSPASSFASSKDSATNSDHGVSTNSNKANVTGFDNGVDNGVDNDAISKKRARSDDITTTDKPATKKPALKPAAPPASSRPSRTRKAPERFIDQQVPAKVTKPQARKPISKVFDPEWATTNSNSRLAKADVFHLLLEASAWSSLAVQQQVQLLKRLPQTPANAHAVAAAEKGEVPAEGLTRPKELDISFNQFRTDVAKWQADLSSGHLAKTWQTAAVQAVKDRRVGSFDHWKAEESELWWGQKGE